MSMSITELERALRSLRLSGMIAPLSARALAVASHEMDFLEAFGCLVQDELDRRRSRLLARRFALSGLPERKDLKDFDWAYNPRLPRRAVLELATLKFIEAREDALLIGAPGLGKSHCAKAIAQLAAGRGYTVLYREAHTLIEDIHEARELGELRKHRAQLKVADLLVIDDSVPAQVTSERRRRTRRRADEPLRKALDDHHVEPTGRGLGQVARRRGHRHAAARPADAPRTSAEVRRQELAAARSGGPCCAARRQRVTIHPSRRVRWGNLPGHGWGSLRWPPGNAGLR